MPSTSDAIRIEPGGEHAADTRALTRDVTSAAYALLVAAVALAWVPMCSRYVPVADDLGLGSDLSRGFFQYLYHAPTSQIGIWRCVGFSLAGVGINHPDWYGPAILTLHAIVTCLLFKTARQMLGDFRMALLIALAFGVYPAAGQAITWAAAAPIVILEGLFLLLLLSLFHACDKPRWRLPALIVGFTAAFGAQLVQENLVFAFCAAGCILWIPETRCSMRQLRTRIAQRYYALGPILGAIAFILLWGLLPGDHPVKSSNGIRPLSAISPYIRLDAVAMTFAPWLHHDTRSLFAWGWSISMTVALIAALVAIVATAVSFYRKRRAVPEPACPPTVALLVILIALSLGVSAVYAAAGGFSLDSRKQYVLVPQMLLVIGWIVRRSGLKLDRAMIPIALLIVLTGVPSTWLYVNVWRHESFCLSQLVQTAIDNNISGPVQIQWTPDIYRTWPSAASTWGFRFDEPGIMEPSFILRGLPRLRPVKTNAPITFTFDPARNAWHIQRNSTALASGDKP